jgi:Cu/Ag efflux protein CusF
MRKIMLVAVALAASTVGMTQIAEQAWAEEMKVTGKVTEADQEAKKITVGDKTFDLSDQAGTSMFPQVGAEVTVFYEEQDGKNVVTRIGNAQQ